MIRDKRYSLLHYVSGPRKLGEVFNMNLMDSTNREKFVAMLEKVEPHVGRALDSWESTFVEDMRSRFDCRDDQIDLGMTPWNPTVNQWNTLHGIASKF